MTGESADRAATREDGPGAAAGGDGEGPPVPRRWLIRLLVGLGLGIPIVIEGATFGRLVSERLFGGDDGAEPTATTTARRAVGVGDELLPETTPTERLSSATVDAGDERWRLVLTVEVQNTGRVPYELELGAVTTADGERVPGEATTGRIPPGQSAFVTGAYSLATGATPESVVAAAITHGADAERREYRVALASIPVER